ncbi:ion transporter [Noviherbaspirillum galbum]|uniref:Ion transporter n=1 Tax=Noviherbaspirillum galbum TaxID=2709383 RepID=A0A6B3SJB4_9BURK|nr:ion transporter [Noviherbaspirillum galbum]NEX60944.1 ion transporter [Noviherbaspirillum galbum]
MSTLTQTSPASPMLAFVESAFFRRTVITLILLNALLLGLDTIPDVSTAFGNLLSGADRIIVWFFVAELALRIGAYRGKFFRSGWNWFDLAIVALSFMPNSDVLSVLRVLRLLRLIAIVPSLRVVVEGLIAALPGMGAVSLLMAIFMFIGGVIVTKMFGAKAPTQFGDLFISTFSLLQVTTLDGWPDMARAAMKTNPSAWVFFFGYIFVTTFTVMNLFVGVMVSSMEERVAAHKEEQAKARALEAQLAGRDAPESESEDTRMLLAELKTLRQELGQLRAEVRGQRRAEAIES